MMKMIHMLFNFLSNAVYLLYFVQSKIFQIFLIGSGAFILAERGDWFSFFMHLWINDGLFTFVYFILLYIFYSIHDEMVQMEIRLFKILIAALIALNFLADAIPDYPMEDQHPLPFVFVFWLTIYMIYLINVSFTKKTSTFTFCVACLQLFYYLIVNYLHYKGHKGIIHPWTIMNQTFPIQ